MTVAGRKPKPEGLKRNRVKPVHDWAEVPNVPFKDGRKLPARWLEGRAWPTRTKSWWAALSSMPHCVLWTDADWEYAVDTAYVHATFAAGDMRAATELRNREKLLGNTFDSRRDIRVRYIDPAADESESDASVTAIADYRKMLDG